jgi:hypothetical protein
VAEGPVVLPPAWQWEHIVKNLTLFLAIVCGGATVVSIKQQRTPRSQQVGPANCAGPQARFVIAR